jgi:hypothetical protein
MTRFGAGPRDRFTLSSGVFPVDFRFRHFRSVPITPYRRIAVAHSWRSADFRSRRHYRFVLADNRIEYPPLIKSRAGRPAIQTTKSRRNALPSFAPIARNQTEHSNTVFHALNQLAYVANQRHFS